MFGDPNPTTPNFGVAPPPSFASMMPTNKPKTKGGGFGSTILTSGQGDPGAAGTATAKKSLLGA